MVNSSKPSSDSWLTSSTVFTTLYSNGISAPKHRARSRQLAKNANARRRAHDGGAGHAEEESVFDDARDLVKRRAECSVDGPEAGVQDQVAIVGLEGPTGRHPELGPPAQGLDRAAGRLPQEGQNLDRYRPAPKAAHELALVGDQDESPAGMRDDLLPQERPPAPLDAVNRRVDLVGAVDGQVERPVDFLRDRDATRLGLGPALLRGRDC